MNHSIRGLLPEEQRLHPVLMPDYRCMKPSSPPQYSTDISGHPLFLQALPMVKNGLLSSNLLNMHFPLLPPGMFQDSLHAMSRTTLTEEHPVVYPRSHPPRMCQVIQANSSLPGSLPALDHVVQENTKYAQQVIDSRRKAVASTNALKAWLYEHRKNPYPTKGEKIMLAILTKMSLTQVSTWFANARRRLKKDCVTSGEVDLELEDSEEEIDVGTEHPNLPYSCIPVAPLREVKIELKSPSVEVNLLSTSEELPKNSLHKDIPTTNKRPRIWSIDDVISMTPKRRSLDDDDDAVAEVTSQSANNSNI